MMVRSCLVGMSLVRIFKLCRLQVMDSRMSCTFQSLVILLHSGRNRTDLVAYASGFYWIQAQL